MGEMGNGMNTKNQTPNLSWVKTEAQRDCTSFQITPDISEIANCYYSVISILNLMNYIKKLNTGQNWCLIMHTDFLWGDGQTTDASQ